MNKYKCPCCGNFALTENPPGTYEICEICGWEDDELQYVNPDYKGGANEISLNLAKKEFYDKQNIKNDKH